MHRHKCVQFPPFPSHREYLRLWSVVNLKWYRLSYNFFLESSLWYFAKYNIRVVMYILHIISIAILKGHITLLAQTCDCSYLITIIEQGVLNTLRSLWYWNVNSRLFYFHTFFYDIDKRILGIYHFLPETINSNLIKIGSLLIVRAK